VGKKKFNDHPFPYHTEIELEIATLTNLGLGLGRVQIEKQKSKIESAGWVVMVPFTLPGEKVRARVYRNHKNFSEADLLEVLTPSPHRVAPRCALFGQCGGCQYQHLAYTEQLAWKRRQVEELLRHMVGVAFPVAPTVPSPREFGYRSKITPHFQVSRANPRDEPQADGAPSGRARSPIGFLKQGSRFDLVDVPQCPIATPEINEKLTEVRAKTRARLAAGEYQRAATLLLRHAQEGVVTDYDAVIHEVIGAESDLRAGSAASEKNPSGGRVPPAKPLRLRFLARDFFQNNPFILPAFTGYMRAQAAANGARFLVDAYCGSGLFALSCAPAFERVAGIEVSETSVRFATENAAANGIANATFATGDAAAIFAGLAFPPVDTAVVIDPPRKGCDEAFLRQLFAFGPRAVVYVSCDPATQMRDLKGFLAAGYALTAVQPFDLFPQTRHLECVITLVRR
jgi:23S rRNA (uracil1939-C5)-methyltransferase/tRNA (uracil-5-)-methyltransferase